MASLTQSEKKRKKHKTLNPYKAKHLIQRCGHAHLAVAARDEAGGSFTVLSFRVEGFKGGGVGGGV